MSELELEAQSDASCIGPSLKLQGCLRLEGDLEVQGYVEGPLNVLGNVRVTPTGVVRGNLVANSAVIEGRVVGQVRGRREVKIEHGALVHGDILSPKVSLSHRAQHRGNVTLVKAHLEMKEA